jgi:hypothetical protein
LLQAPAPRLWRCHSDVPVGTYSETIRSCNSDEHARERPTEEKPIDPTAHIGIDQINQLMFCSRRWLIRAQTKTTLALQGVYLVLRWQYESQKKYSDDSTISYGYART